MYVNYNSYEDYNTTSKSYDTIRRPVALKQIFDILEKVSNNLGKPVSELTLLDAGCGTGNYIEVMHSRVGNIIGVEYNEGMVTKAKVKFANNPKIQLKQLSLYNTGLPDACADAIIMNQVIHHLDT